MGEGFFPTVGPVAIAYDADALSGSAADVDVLDQIEAVEAAVARGGGVSVRVPVGLDLAAFRRVLSDAGAGLVFNLVESLGRSDRLQTVVPLLLEDWGVPFTGSGSAAMLLSNHKVGCKRRLVELGLPTADCVWMDARGNARRLFPAESVSGDWIVKAVESHASLYLDDDSLMRGADGDGLRERVAAVSRERGQAFFAERFVDGREFNLSVLEGADGVARVLPAAEIRFDGLPAGRVRMVGHAAKWAEESAEYRGTERTFSLRDGDAGLVRELERLALAVWDALALRGYARVDFRVDGEGRPFILEANANPCLSPDAGFAAAAARGGMPYDGMVEAIVAAAL